jgi:thiamine biosynthesis lipoprotein
MIDIGGEVRVRGRNAAQEAWRIAVEKPIDSQPTPFAILSLTDISVATSGEYRHYYARDGRRYSHTIDPRTGEPVVHTLASVVVLHRRAAYADAWATAFNVMGAEVGDELAVRLGIPAMFIVAEGEELRAKTSAGFARYMPAEDL